MRTKEEKLAYDKRWQKEHQPEVNKYHRNYRNGHPEYCEKQNDARKRRSERDHQRYEGNPLRFISATRKRKYGITQEEFEARIDAQKGLCAICFKPMVVPHIDHNHATGKNRDLLCKNCNTALGLFCESVDILSGAIKYLQRHTTQV